MAFLADTHLHLYPQYDADRFFEQLASNLGRLDPALPRVGLLAERAECRAFSALREGTLPLRRARVAAADGPGGAALAVSVDDADPVFLLPGRQIATAERIEVLALTVDAAIEDGQPAEEVLAAVHAAGGIAVLPWAPGKWFFARGRLVARLIAAAQPGGLLVADTTLRPRGWPFPRLMHASAARGLGVVAGSDPLPFAGEERFAGCYATRFPGGLDPADPAGSVRRALCAAAAADLLGRRCGLTAVLRRLNPLRNPGPSASVPTASRT